MQLFQIDVDRSLWVLQREGAQIEVALDSGEIRLSNRRSAIRECELGLIFGPVLALFFTANEIADLSDVRVGVLSKSERG